MKRKKREEANEPGVSGSGEERHQLSRRSFLKGAGATVATVGAASVVSGCDTLATPATSTQAMDPNIITTAPTALGGPETALYVCPIEENRPLEFFRPHEARTVEAITARLLPGDAEDPGAREAGVVYYIDCVLASGPGYGEPTYRESPYAIGYDEEDPPSEEDLSPDYGVVWIPKEQLDRYGYQSILTPREAYRVGLAALDRYANERFDSDFVDLSEEEQDAIVEALAQDEATGFDDPSAADFFEMLRDHTIEGMFSDPIYGGNRNMVGWRLVGYPGAQRGYTPREMKTEGHRREPQSLLSLHHYHPGRTEQPNVILPVVGSDR